MRRGPFTPPNPGSTAVPAYLPLGFIAAGIAGFLLLLLGLSGALPSSFLYVRHNPQLLVLVHLFTLVWGSGVTMGVMHQMAPVILAAPLHSVKAGWITLALFAPGSYLLALSFGAYWLQGVILGGVFVICGALLCSYNIVRTVRNKAEQNVTSKFFTVALAAFVATLAAGIAMAAALRFGLDYRWVGRLLGVHALLGGGGWLTGVIIAVSYRLIPMFLLVHGHDEAPAARILATLYAGVALGVAGALLGGAYALPGVAIYTAATLWWAADMRAMWKKRSRKPDVWMKQVPVAIGCLVTAAVAGFVAVAFGALGYAVRPQIILAVGLLFALGGVSNMMLALLHKIVPFLVWYHRYSGTVGREKAPTMRELTSEKTGHYVFPLYHAAVVVIVSASAWGAQGIAQGGAWSAALVGILLVHDLVALIVPLRTLWQRVWRHKEKWETG